MREQEPGVAPSSECWNEHARTRDVLVMKMMMMMQLPRLARLVRSTCSTRQHCRIRLYMSRIMPRDAEHPWHGEGRLLTKASTRETTVPAPLSRFLRLTGGNAMVSLLLPSTIIPTRTWNSSAAKLDFYRSLYVSFSKQVSYDIAPSRDPSLLVETRQQDSFDHRCLNTNERQSGIQVSPRASHDGEETNMFYTLLARS